MNDTILELNTSLDQSDMKGAISGFPGQIKDSFSIMSTWVQKNNYQNIENIRWRCS